jgi:hypothetical protein
MKTLSFMFFALTVAAPAMAVPPDVKPPPAVCKAELKEWSEQKTEMLTIEKIYERMNRMVACADEAHRHRHSDKKALGYLNEFYRVHTELANRTFDFIMKHNLKAQFDEEENGVTVAKLLQKSPESN